LTCFILILLAHAPYVCLTIHTLHAHFNLFKIYTSSFLSSDRDGHDTFPSFILCVASHRPGHWTCDPYIQTLYSIYCCDPGRRRIYQERCGGTTRREESRVKKHRANMGDDVVKKRQPASPLPSSIIKVLNGLQDPCESPDDRLTTSVA
jgi:hypothetical protein